MSHKHTLTVPQLESLLSASKRVVDEKWKVWIIFVWDPTVLLHLAHIYLLLNKEICKNISDMRIYFLCDITILVFSPDWKVNEAYVAIMGKFKKSSLKGLT